MLQHELDDRVPHYRPTVSWTEVLGTAGRRVVMSGSALPHGTVPA